MAYRKLKKRILAGSLNLLPPTDKTPAGDSIRLQNWRVDQAGQLKSRHGIMAESASLGGDIHSLFRFGEDRYGGVGSSLKYGAGLGTSVTSGFDGSRIWMAAYQGFLWAMNRGKRGKADGPTFHNWLPEAPSTAPTATAGPTNTVTLREFDNTETWTLTQVSGTPSGTPSQSFDAGNKKSGTHALVSNCTAAGLWDIASTFPMVDLRFSEEELLDDLLRFWFYSSAPAAVSGLTVTLTDSDGNTVYATVDRSWIDTSAYSWVQVSISREIDVEGALKANTQYQILLRAMVMAQVAGNNLLYEVLRQQVDAYVAALRASGQLVDRPYFRTPSAGGAFNWWGVVGMTVQVSLTSSAQIGMDLCEMVGGPTGSLEGEFVFYVTYDTAAGHESNPSPATAAVTLNKQSCSLSSIPVSSDPQVIARNIYGLGGSLDTPLLFLTIGDNITTSAEVSVSIDDVQTRNRAMPTDADPPPFASGVLGPYRGRLLAWSSLEHKNRLWWTPTAQPWKFPGSGDVAGNWVDVGDDEEAIIRVTEHTSMAVLYKERSIWRLIGDPDANDPEKSASSIGAVGASAICPVGTSDYFVAQDGVYRFTGDWAEKVSVKIDPIFKGDYVDLGGGVSIPPMNPDARHTCVLEHVSGNLYLSYPDATSATPNTTLVYEIDSGRWSHFKVSAGGFSALYYEGPRWAFLGGMGGVLYRLEQGLSDNGAVIPLIWQSEYIDMGLPDNPKVMCDLVVVHRTAESGEAPSTLTVKLLYDNGATQEAVGSITSTSRTVSRFPLGTGGKGTTALNASLLVEGNCTSTVVIFEAYLHYYVEARYAKSFDTGVMDFGGVVEVQEVQIDTTAPGTLSLTLYTDLPGNTITSRETKTWAGGAGRRTLAYQFPLQSIGRRGRLFVGSDQDFQVHSFKVRVLPVGVYIDGAAGEVWQPEAIS